MRGQVVYLTFGYGNVTFWFLIVCLCDFSPWSLGVEEFITIGHDISVPNSTFSGPVAVSCPFIIFFFLLYSDYSPSPLLFSNFSLFSLSYSSFFSDILHLDFSPFLQLVFSSSILHTSYSSYIPSPVHIFRLLWPNASPSSISRLLVCILLKGKVVCP
jgi:hypothetical protein